MKIEHVDATSGRIKMRLIRVR